MLDFGIVVAIIIVLFILTIVIKGARIVQQSECVIIERLGRYSSTLTSGFNVIIPFIDQPRQVYWVKHGRIFLANSIDLRENVFDVPEQSVITKDNVSINIDALLYVQITDPVRATYEISNLPVAVAQLAQTSLRNVIGEMDLDETLGSRDIINNKLKFILDEATDKWGMKVNRVELKNIMPPADIQNAMEKQMQAERQRRAQVLEAEGEKQARIARSEGQKQEQINVAAGQREGRILQADGEAQAILKVAEAKRAAMELIKSVVGDNELTVKFLLATNYLDTFGEFVQKEGDKVYIPYEASTALSGIGSIRDILSGKS